MSKFDGMTNAIDNWQSGLRDGLPIAIAYFAVSFAFGIAATKSHLPMFDAFLMSLTNMTSAGQFSALTLIPTGISYFEMAIAQIILNLRYLIMSCSLSQKYDSDLPLIHRCICAFPITDELFGIVCCQPGKVSPFYTYGLMTLCVPSWCLGTICGCYSGTLLSPSLISTLGIVIYAMFFAIIVPPSKKDKVIRNVCISALVLGYGLSIFPISSVWSSGIRIIIVTFIVAGIAAIVHPIKDNDVATTTAEAMAQAHREAMEVDLYE